MSFKNITIVVLLFGLALIVLAGLTALMPFAIVGGISVGYAMAMVHMRLAARDIWRR